jgi:DNA polymerase II large subunit
MNFRSETLKYFENFKNEVEKIYRVSSEVRKKGFDPVFDVEVSIANSMAEKVVNLIATIYPQLIGSGVVERILELEKEYGKLNPTVVFKIAEEVSEGIYCNFESVIQAMDAGIRVGFAYITLGVVSSPIEGFTGIEVGKRYDGKEYIVANFSGPIRSAGTTASCLVLILIDYLREKFGYDKYDPNEDEVKRFYIELCDFNDRVANLQYMPTEEEVDFIIRNLSIQISGDPSESLEVSNFKNLERVNTNYLRSGVCLVLGEGLAQKAAKGKRLFDQAKNNGVSGTGFDWLGEYVELHKRVVSGRDCENETPSYIRDLMAGRPIFSHPSRSGGFRFRYGRSRNSGFSAVALHPATMAITDNFIAIGSQLKIEKPTKGCTVTACDSIEGPIVRLNSGSVRQLISKREAEELYEDIDEIIYLGDILFPYSDMLNRNVDLVKPGYVEEWHRVKFKELGGGNLELENIDLNRAVEHGKKYNIPLHPKFIFYWSQINKNQLREIVEFVRGAECGVRGAELREALGILGVCFEIIGDRILIEDEVLKALKINLGDLNSFIFEGENVLDIVNKNSKYEIKDKAGDFIGARLGRPEKAKIRKILGSPNSLFPVGMEGGRLKTMQNAYSVGNVSSNFPLYYCNKCEKQTVFRKCEKCDFICEEQYYFKDLNEISFDRINYKSKFSGVPYNFRSIDFKKYFDLAVDNLLIKEDVPDVIKSVKSLKSRGAAVEKIEKGILRAKYNLQVNKDGTIRFDATELPLTHFKPREIGTSIIKLKELGYYKDYLGNDLINENQILELMPHDILLPSCNENPNENGDVVFMNICNFIDDLLTKFYGFDSIYDVRKKEDLIGQLGVCMAPHNCAGVACRIIGFSNTLSLMASPYMHAAIRRDCDGDECAIMLLSDVLLNFSRKFLPKTRGGTQDAPLVINIKIDAGEVDDQILDFECVDKYPLELYEKAEKRLHSSEVMINTVRQVLDRGEDPFVNIGFTHDVKDFNDGVLCSSYKTLEDMNLKIKHQMDLIEKIRAADVIDAARLVIETHFLKDIKGNLRKFSQQSFRCIECNNVLRRPPLSGKCSCGGKLVFTVNEGGIKKYLKLAIELANKYDVGEYLRSVLDLLKDNIDSVFGQPDDII